jgi:hypothetical protein
MVDVDLFDSKSGLKIAVVSLDLKFIIDSIPESTISAIGNLIGRKNVGDQSDKVAMELALKQAFVNADVDKSGSITFDEVIIFKKLFLF